MRAALLSLVVSSLVAAAWQAAGQTPVGALAIDERQGIRWGWAVDYETAAAARAAALEECGAGCSVVLTFGRCGAYAADQAGGSTAYGWGESYGSAEGARERASRSAARVAVRAARSGRGAATARWWKRAWPSTVRRDGRSSSASEPLDSTRAERTGCSARTRPPPAPTRPRSPVARTRGPAQPRHIHLCVVPAHARHRVTIRLQPRPAQGCRGHDHARVLGADAHRPLARGKATRSTEPWPSSSRPRPRSRWPPPGARGAPPPATASSSPPPAGAKPSTWSTPGTGPSRASRRSPTSPTASPRSPPRPSRPPSTRPPTSSTGSC